MFGKLTINAIPLHEPIIMYTIYFVFLLFLIISITITYFKKWKWLWNEYLISLDHKKIGIMYIIMSIIMFIRGFADALMMRSQQAIVSSGKTGFLTSNHYNQIFTAHGVIMIFFMAMPFIIGFMNLIIPLQIGARDVAFPFLNSLSFWLFFVSALLINISLCIGEFAQTGWLAYPPLSNKQYSPGVGVDYWIWSLQISGIGTLLTGINFIVTILKMRAPGMSLMKMPIFTWTSLCSNILIVLSFPILTVTISLLAFDRYLGAHFFTNDMGGNIMMYINLIWAWGHPEVYILMLPAFGIFSEITSTFSKKKLFGYKSLVLATIVITILSFIVWLHHFFTMGAGANVNSFFGITTMIIAIPTGVKIFNWIFTMYKGNIKYNSAMLWTIGFIISFSIGGMSGVLLSVPGADFYLHNSLFLIAHFHNVIIGGVVFGCFAGITYWFPKFFGFKLNEKWGVRAFWFWISGFFISFLPLYALGFMGMTRRLSQNINSNFHTLLIISAIGTLIILIGIICQIIQFYISIYNKKTNLDITGDPWDGRTLEWFTSSPPKIYNFAIIPVIKDIDAFWNIKNNKNPLEIKKFKSIKIPKNTCIGLIISLFVLIFGFSMIWYIWWLSLISIISIISILIFKSFNITNYYKISKEDIIKNESSFMEL
ncbi:cytochrome o ubiquinol oxidase subunit I [Enterobacteriaceae bacterium ET-AT1-13]|nr:cytochrome o ubiquinol oxidase subunit I [Enterobacteriaceae bacterium ET-AT1-13]WGS66407.1 cytochrome o ubiquinol oxidase subunit I [Enterobacteriaceae bacterium Cmel17]WMC17433.1 MAG: cytochrome o ubiquinol oxidase subunit I [Enterobacteriaceae bacterium Cmel21]WMC17639.1 MAG: cytochrome o ubiquinol oxidase subunit I [Enterobacteriaceae bacterium PSmelAO3-2]WMC17844.1 MAG: cytochrome o ubiquinol oxidase subunit I [Enterobacteriaceae bacterium PSmelAO3-1]WMC18047.1 MAG: cytochrome o ubiqui